MEELSVPNAGLVDKLLALGPGYSAARAAGFHLDSHQGRSARIGAFLSVVELLRAFRDLVCWRLLRVPPSGQDRAQYLTSRQKRTDQE
jgi:hypothetical protein